VLAILQEVPSVPALDRGDVVPVGGALGRELSHRVEHRKAGLRIFAGVRLQQRRLVEQGRHDRLQTPDRLPVADRLYPLQ
jgi:hypothetical protein